MAALIGDKESSAHELAEARSIGGSEVDEAIAWVALADGDPARAEVAAARAGTPLGHALGADALLELSRRHEAEARLEEAGNHPFALLVRARFLPNPLPVLADVPTRGVIGARARRLHAIALLEHEPPDVEAAHTELSTAVWRLLRLGAVGELGRCYLTMADAEVANADAKDVEARQRAAVVGPRAPAA